MHAVNFKRLTVAMECLIPNGYRLGMKSSAMEMACVLGYSWVYF